MACKLNQLLAAGPPGPSANRAAQAPSRCSTAPIGRPICRPASQPATLCSRAALDSIVLHSAAALLHHCLAGRPAVPSAWQLATKPAWRPFRRRFPLPTARRLAPQEDYSHRGLNMAAAGQLAEWRPTGLAAAAARSCIYALGRRARPVESEAAGGQRGPAAERPSGRKFDQFLTRIHGRPRRDRHTGAPRRSSGAVCAPPPVSCITMPPAESSAEQVRPPAASGQRQ